MNKAEIFSLEDKFKKLEKTAKITILNAFKLLNKKRLLVEVFLAGSDLMGVLNSKFKNKNCPANVLSFQEPEDFLCFYGRGRRKIGEIFLNAAGLQPEAEKLDLADETAALKKLLIHSLLHLLRYTHYKRNDRIKMERLENKLLLNV